MTRTKVPKRTPLQRKKSFGVPARIFSQKQLDQVELLSKLGATDEQVALFFGVHKLTVYNWGQTKPEFREARKRGGMVADMKVAQCLFQRAIGFDYEEKEYQLNKKNEMQLYRVVKKHAMPDVKAIIHWLRVRQREIWTVVPEMQLNHLHSGRIEHLHNNLEDIPVDELSKKAQELLFEITTKQLTSGDRDN